MLKRCLSPLTLVNQLALIVLLSTAIGVTGMAISGWLVQGYRVMRMPSTRQARYACRVTVCWRRFR
jgi:hypothetical protein